MLFIREYNAKSLDRSSVSMIDKYNTRLDRVDELLDKLSFLINDLLSLIRDIRNTLGQSKQRIYANLDQVKEVIEGNGITGTEATVKTIEDALKAGDKAIDEAETTLEGVGRAIDCNEVPCNDANSGNEECGENPNQTSSDEGCDVCSFSQQGSDGTSWSCEVCDLGECTVNLSCDEPDVNYTGSGECQLSYTCDDGAYGCGEVLVVNGACGETSCSHSGNLDIPEGCNFDCTHSTPCSQSPMPDGCTYTCVDGEGCNYSGDDCSYGTVCGQAEACNQIDCGQYDCGEPCGETCHMTTDNNGDCSDEVSCGEGSDDLSDDDYYGGGDDTCGEGCGDSCGL